MHKNSIHSIVCQSSKRKSNSFLRIWHFLKIVNLVKTLYVNFVCFPFNTAIKLPVFVGYRVEFIGLRRNCIRINSVNRVRTGMIELGITRFPLISTKGMYTLVRIHKKSHIEMGDNVRVLCGGSLIAALGGVIHIGNDFTMNQKARIYASKKVSFGNHSGLSWEAQVMDSDFHYTFNQNTKRIKDCHKPVIIGNYCYLGNRTSVMKGAVLPDYSILASCSLLNRDYSEVTDKGNIFAGTPAAFKSSGIFWYVNEKLERKIRDFFSMEDYDHIVIEDDFDFSNVLD